MGCNENGDVWSFTSLEIYPTKMEIITKEEKTRNWGKSQYPIDVHIKHIKKKNTFIITCEEEGT
jgi:hypothetical protein